MSNEFDYYDFGSLLSRNAVYNFVVGARGVGKTYGAKKFVIRKAIEKGDEFIYMRRYKTELKDKTSWFGDVAKEFPDYAFRVNGSTAEYKLQIDVDDKKIPWKPMGYFIALSNSASKKSVPYPNVKTIIFDEFIVEKGVIRYLNNESTVFNDFYSTVDRYQDKTRVLFLANSVSITNPYFIAYDILPKPGQEFIQTYNGFICVNVVNSKEFGQQVLKTRFGQFIKGSDYEKYAVGNDFTDNSNVMIGPKGTEYLFLISIETPLGMFSVWFPPHHDSVYISDYIPTNSPTATLDPNSVRDGVALIQYSGPCLSICRRLFSGNKATFSSPKARNAFLGIWKNR